MFEILEIVQSSYKDFLDQGDPRVEDWLLVKSPMPGIAMIAAYLYFVKVAGPQFMKNRKPFDLRLLMIVFNFMLVFINTYLFIAASWHVYINGYNLKCEPVDYSNNPKVIWFARLGHFFYLSKFVEFGDTIFFVLRKKDRQISALHVIHHSIVPFVLWFPMKFAPGGYNFLFCYMNAFIHIIMYTYYGLAALGDKYKKYLFWKKYLTYLQLGQFVVLIMYSISLWYHECGVSNLFITMMISVSILFFVLFLNFFLKNYTKKSSPEMSPTFLIKEYSSQDFEKKTPEPVFKEEDSHLKSEMEKEVDSHMTKQHSHDSESCWRMRDKIQNNGIKNGNGNCCIPETMKSLRNGYSSSVPDSLNVKKIRKEL